MSGSRNGFAVTITAVDAASKQIDAVNAHIKALAAPGDQVAKSLAKLGDTTGLTRLGGGMRNLASESFQAFENISRVAAPLSLVTGAASIAGLARMSAQWANFATQTGLAAQRSGATVAQLGNLQGAAQLAGSSSEAMTAGMVALKDTIFNIATGAAPQAAAAFDYLKVAWRDAATGGLRPTEEVMTDLIGKLNAIQDPTQRARLGADALAGTYEGLIPIINRGVVSWQKSIEVAKQYNHTTDASVVSALRQREATARLTMAGEDLQRTLSEALEPSVTRATRGLEEFIEKHRATVATDVSEWATTYGKAFGGIATAVDTAVTKTIGWDTALGIGLPLALSRAIPGVGKLENALAKLIGIRLPMWLAALMGIPGAAGGAAVAGIGALMLGAGALGGKMNMPFLNENGGITAFPGEDPRDKPASNEPPKGNPIWNMLSDWWHGRTSPPPSSSDAPAGTPDPGKAGLADGQFNGPVSLGAPKDRKALAQDIQEQVTQQAQNYGLDPEHMTRLAQAEAGGKSNRSGKGAYGTMQLMPETAKEQAAQMGVDVEPGNWQQNVMIGMHYYRQLLDKYKGNYRYADAAYNAGFNKAGVKHFVETGDMSQLPNETKSYVNGINGAPIAGPPPEGGAPANVQDGTGAGGQGNTTTVRGSANVKISLAGAPPGTRATTTASGDLFEGGRVETAMAGMN